MAEADEFSLDTSIPQVHPNRISGTHRCEVRGDGDDLAALGPIVSMRVPDLGRASSGVPTDSRVSEPRRRECVGAGYPGVLRWCWSGRVAGSVERNDVPGVLWRFGFPAGARDDVR